MPDRPHQAHRVGTVTFVFTDLVGSTELLERLGDDAGDVLRRRHFELLRSAMATVGGREVKSLGDGLMVAFPSAVDAVACAVKMQQHVFAHNAAVEAESALSVRIGLHGGDSLQEDDDYFGTPVVIAKRLCDSALGGQILVSELVRNLVGSRGGFEFRDVGWLALKGVGEPTPAQEVIWSPDQEVQTRTLRLDETAPRPVRWLVPALALAVALVAGIALASIIGDDSGDAGSPRTPPQSGVDGAIDISAVSFSLVTQPEIFRLPGDQAITRIAASRSTGLIAVGYDAAAGDKDAAAWTSIDGNAWTRVATTEAFGGEGDQVMWGVKDFRDGLIAVGEDGSGGDADAAVWNSDGVVWDRLAHDEEVFGGPGEQVMNRIVDGGLGVVALGFDTSGGDKDAAVWESRDGRRWIRDFHAEALFGGPGNQEMRSVVELERDSLLAVGYDEAEGNSDAAVWLSDFRRWKRVRPHAEVFGRAGHQRMTTVAQGPSGVVAVGSDDAGTDEDAAVWLAGPNGKGWARVEDDAALGGPGDQMMLGVDATPFGFVAVGREVIDGDIDAAVWFSPNGRDWERISSDDVFGGAGEQQAKWVLVTGDRVVIGGWAESGDGLDAAVWVADLP